MWSDLEKVLCSRWAYRKVNQVGRHIILQTETPRHHRLALPNYRPNRIGLLSAVYREVAGAKGVSPDDILETLY
jgi:hypothetical protein